MSVVTLVDFERFNGPWVRDVGCDAEFWAALGGKIDIESIFDDGGLQNSGQGRLEFETVEATGRVVLAVDNDELFQIVVAAAFEVIEANLNILQKLLVGNGKKCLGWFEPRKPSPKMDENFKLPLKMTWWWKNSYRPNAELQLMDAPLGRF